MSRIGMSPAYVQNYSPSTLASKLRPYAKRVTETEQMSVWIEKSKDSASGYKIVFDNFSKQLPLPSLSSGFTKAEVSAFDLLGKNKLYPNVAKSVVVQCRRAMGKQAPEYIKYVVGRFNRDLVRKNKLTVPPSKIPGVLKTFFDKSWMYPEFVEWQSKKLKSEQKQEVARYSNSVQSIGNVIDSSFEKPTESPAVIFTLKNFKKDYSKSYNQIFELVQKRYRSFDLKDIDITEKELNAMIDRALVCYCEEAFKEFKKGRTDYLPQGLTD